MALVLFSKERVRLYIASGYIAEMICSTERDFQHECMLSI